VSNRCKKVLSDGTMEIILVPATLLAGVSILGYPQLQFAAIRKSGKF